jgi:hypothetical protein
MVARAGDSLQHASPCLAGPTMCSLSSLCGVKQGVSEQYRRGREHGRC